MSLEMAVVDYLAGMGVAGEAEVSLLLTRKADMRKIAAKYKKQLGDTEPTDHEVLAFPLGMEEDPWNPDGVKRLGDIVLVYPQTQEKLEELAVHGCKHLLGINHE
jgi:ssRNA-specific RNase YbeY (16S rRNA maturation enzyme)